MNDMYKKTGYLESEYKIFYLIDTKKKEIEYHYHDFYKILIFLNGNVSYNIEGRVYNLQKGDVVLVNAGDIHKPIIYDDVPYERIIVYVSAEFFRTYNIEKEDLFYCFNETKKQQSNLIRVPDYKTSRLAAVAHELTTDYKSNEFGALLYQRIKFIEFLIVLNRMILNKNADYGSAMTANPTVLKIMQFINENIINDLSVDRIAETMYLNRSYIMHLFKAETGYTIGNYISEKRLFIARQYIMEGIPITEACYKSGFKNYTTFYHAYKKKYQLAPKENSNGIIDMF